MKQHYNFLIAFSLQPIPINNIHVFSYYKLGLGDMAKKIIKIIFFISVDIDNYHDKCQIFISFKFKARILLQSESCRNQIINFP